MTMSPSQVHDNLDNLPANARQYGRENRGSDPNNLPANAKTSMGQQTLPSNAVPLNFDLHPKQGDVYVSLATEILFGGGAGGGKSHLKRAAAIIWCLEIPGLQIYLFRRTFPDLWKNHMEGPTSFPVMLTPFIKFGLSKINYTLNKISFPTMGSAIHLCHCQYEKDRWQYQGAEMHVLMIDEITHFTDKIYRFLRSRVRMAETVKSALPPNYRSCFPRVVASGNPGGVGHNWVKSGWIDLLRPYEICSMPKKEGGMRRQFIPSLLEDNPSLDPDEYEGQLEGIGDDALVKAMRHGDWDIVAGGAIDDVWEPAIHVIDPFKIPDTWYIDRTFDWGSSKPFAVLWWAESDGSEVEVSTNVYRERESGDGTVRRTFPPGTLFLIYEYYGWNGRPNEGIKLADSEIAKQILLIDDIIGDRVYSGAADTTIFDVDNNGRAIVKEYELQGVYWEKANKNPGSRTAGLQILRAKLRASLQKPMEEPGIFIFSHCHQFKRTIPVLPRDERRVDDVDTDSEDHIFDAVRYRLLQHETQKPSIRQLVWTQ